MLGVLLWLIVTIFAFVIVGVLIQDEDVRHGVWTALGLVGALLFVIGIITYIECVYDNGRLVAAQKNLPAMKLVAQRLNDIAVVQNIAEGKMIGGLENLQQSSNASEAFIAYRDAIIKYNTIIAGRRIVRRIPLIGLWWTNLPPDVEMIDVEL